MAGEMCGRDAAPAIFSGCNGLPSISEPEFVWLIDTARIVWPIKTAQHLQAVTGVSLRTAKYWLAGDHVPSGAALYQLFGAIEPELERRLEAVRLRRPWLDAGPPGRRH